MPKNKDVVLNRRFSERLNYLIKDRNIGTKLLAEEVSENLKLLGYDGKLPILPQRIASWRKNVYPKTPIRIALEMALDLERGYFGKVERNPERYEARNSYEASIMLERFKQTYLVNRRNKISDDQVEKYNKIMILISDLLDDGTLKEKDIVENRTIEDDEGIYGIAKTGLYDENGQEQVVCFDLEGKEFFTISKEELLNRGYKLRHPSTPD